MAGSTLASPSAEPAVAASASATAVSPGRETWRRFRRHKLAMASTVVLALLVLGVVIGPWLWPVAINDRISPEFASTVLSDMPSAFYNESNFDILSIGLARMKSNLMPDSRNFCI